MVYLRSKEVGFWTVAAMLMLLGSSCGREERRRLQEQNAALQLRISEVEAAEALARMEVKRSETMLAAELKSRTVERNLFSVQASNDEVRVKASAAEVAAARKETEELRRQLDNVGDDLKAAIERAENATGWDLIRLKSGKSMVGRVRWVGPEKLALELPDGLMVTGAVNTVELLRMREPGLKPDAAAEPALVSPPTPAAAFPPSTPPPAAPKPAGVTTNGVASASMLPPGPPPRIDLSVIRYRNQKVGEAGKNIVLQIQAPELAVTVANPSIKDDVNGLKARIWIVARGAQDTSEYQIVYAGEQSFDLPAKGTWSFTTEPRKITARLADKFANRSGWELYGYLVRIERDGVLLAEKASVTRLEKILDVLEKKKEGTVFRL